MNKLFWDLSILLMVVAILLLVYVLYNLFYPFKIIEIKNAENLKVSPTQLKPGDDITLHFDSCKFIQLPATVRKQMVNEDELILLPSIQNGTEVPLGCNKLTVTHTIPKLSPPGFYRIYVFVEYKIPPFRTITYQVKTEVFEIVK